MSALAQGGIVPPRADGSPHLLAEPDGCGLFLPLPNPSNRAMLAELMRLHDEGLGT